MNTTEISTTLRDFIADFVRVDAMTDETNIFETGLVNSMFAMQLLLFVEKRFAIKVSNDELDLSNFLSVNAIAAFVSRKLSGATS
jgi:methoxymalonate biosynthesis acyl carrier protein